MAAQIREVEQSRQEVVRSALEVGFQDPEQYPNPLMAGVSCPAPQDSSSLRNYWVTSSYTSIPFPVHWGQATLVEMWVGLGAGRWAVPSVSYWSLQCWGHGPGRLLSTLDTFIFPESNSASGRARSRRGLFGFWKLESNQWVSY